MTPRIGNFCTSNRMKKIENKTRYGAILTVNYVSWSLREDTVMLDARTYREASNKWTEGHPQYCSGHRGSSLRAWQIQQAHAIILNKDRTQNQTQPLS